MLFEAHRGVSTEYPENTMPAYIAALAQGYDYIEADPDYTKDEVLVMFHDWPDIRRTCRRANGDAIEETIAIRDLTFEEACELDAGIFMGEQFKGTKIPTLKELLAFSKENNIPIKIDNVWESFPENMREEMFSQIRAYGENIKVGFTCAKLETLKLAAERFPYADIHYDGGDLSKARLDEVADIAKGHHLYVWVCFDNDMTKWFQGSKASAELCEFVNGYGELGVWILSKKEELAPAICDFKAQIIETTGHIKPEWLEEFK